MLDTNGPISCYYTLIELLAHFLHVLLPIEESENIPTKLLIECSNGTDNYTIGTLSELKYAVERLNAKTNDRLKQDAMIEQEWREIKGETDQAAQLQSNVMPKVNLACLDVGP